MAIFDLRFGFCASKSSPGAVSEVIWPDYGDFKICQCYSGVIVWGYSSNLAVRTGNKVARVSKTKENLRKTNKAIIEKQGETIKT